MNNDTATFIVALTALLLAALALLSLRLNLGYERIGIVAFTDIGTYQTIEADYILEGKIPNCEDIPPPAIGQEAWPVACGALLKR